MVQVTWIEFGLASIEFPNEDSVQAQIDVQNKASRRIGLNHVHMSSGSLCPRAPNSRDGVLGGYPACVVRAASACFTLSGVMGS